MSSISVTCFHCQSNATRKKGLTDAGTQRYQCKECKRSFTFTPAGRKSIGDRPLTNRERVQRHRIKNRELTQAKEATLSQPSDII